jgi:phenylacetate-coenzyme A ligase PaaK-like adenylate-forming protein
MSSSPRIVDPRAGLPFRLHRHADGDVTLVDRDGGVERALAEYVADLERRSRYFGAKLAAVGRLEPGALGLVGGLSATEKADYAGPLAGEALAGLCSEQFAADSSSGSTAKPVARLYRPDDDRADTALTIDVFRRSGLRASDRFVCLDVEAAALHDFYLRAARAAGAARTGYLHLTADIAGSVAPLARLAPAFVLSVPSVLAHAWPALSQLWPPGACPIRCILLIGEPTPAQLRATIKARWCCKVISFYGTTEAGGIGAECAREDGHHVDALTNILTLAAPHFLDSETAEGELLVTTPGQRTHPVLKYRVGDIVRLSTAPCSCGEPTARLWVLRRTQEAFTFAGIKVGYDAILAALRSVAPDLEGITVEISDGAPDGPQVVLRVRIPDAFQSSAPRLRAVLREGIHKLDALCRYGLVQCELALIPSGHTISRKQRRIVDMRSGSGSRHSATVFRVPQ